MLLKDGYKYVHIVVSHHFALSFTRIHQNLVGAGGQRERIKEEGKGRKRGEAG